MSTVLFDAYILSTGYKTPSGLPSWFLKADGSIDSTTYLTSASLANVAYKNQANVFTENQILQDSKELILGTGSDFHIVHNGTNTLLDNYTGGLFIRNLGNGGLTYFQNNDSLGATKNTIIIGGATPDVKLHFNGIQKLATTTGGITITGSVTSSSPDSFVSTVRGRGYYGAAEGGYIQVGGSGGGSSGVLGSAASRGGTLGNNYRTYWAYDAYYDETLDVWKANRTTLPAKMQAEIGYHTGMFKLRYYGGDVTSTWLDEDWTDIFSVDRPGNVVAQGTMTATSFIGDGSQLTNIAQANLPSNVAYTNIDNNFSVGQTITGIGNTAGTNSLVLKNNTGNITFSFRDSGDFILAQPSKIVFANGQYIRDNGGAGLDIATIASTADINFKTQNIDRYAIDQDGHHDFKSGNITTLGKGTFTGTVSGADAVGDTDFVTKQQGFIGSGTENYIPKFGAGGKVLGNSLIYDNGTNVGIGTTSPLTKLQVGDASSINQYLSFQTDNNSERGILYYLADGINIRGYIKWNANEDLLVRGDSIHLNVNGATDALVIQETTGNVGIGTTSPSQKLDVNGNIKLNQYGQSIYFGSTVNEIKGSASDFLYKSFSRVQWDNAGTYTDSSYVFKQSGSEVFRIHTGGNVGIGTTSPSEKLTINVPFSSNGQEGALVAGQTALTTLSGVYSVAEDVVAGKGAMSFKTFNAGAGYGERVRITSLGNVGIGTTSPLDLLHINGNTSINYGYGLKLYNSAKTGWATLSYLETSNKISVTRGIESSSGAFRISSDTGNSYLQTTGGNVGIGTTSPMTRLTVNNGIDRTSTNKTYSSFIHTNDTDDYRVGLATAIKGGATTADRYVSIEASSYRVSTDTFTNNFDIALNPTAGNVGIGTTSPDAKLNVIGGEVKISPDGVGSYAELSIESGSTTNVNLQARRQDNKVLSRTLSLNALGGNVGIGTTSPTQKLHVAGNGLFSGSITANGAQINNVDLVVAGAMVSSQGGYATSSTGGYSIDGKTDADVLLAGGGTTPLSSISGSTPVTTKGDLYTYSTSPTRLPVGSDGKVLMANSSTPTGLVWNDPDWGVVYCDEYALSDETTDLAVGTKKLTFRLPFGLTPIDMRISVGTAPTGSNIIVDVNVNGATKLNTKLSIDAGEKTSVTATSPVDINISYWQDDYEVTVDIDQVGSSIKGAGLKFKLYYVKGVYYPV